MKNDKAVSFLWSCLLSFCLSLSAVLWVVTAFDMKVDIALLTVFCAIAAFVCSICYTLPLGAVPIGIGALVLGYLWRSGVLELSLEALLNRLSRQYNLAYNWGVIRWGLRTADEMEPTMITMLCIFAAMTAMATAWSVCRQKSAVYPLLSIFYVAVCFVVNDTVPATGWIFLLFLTVTVLMLTGAVRRQNAKAGNRLCLILTPLIVLGLFALFLLHPKSTYDGQETAKQMLEKVLGSDPMQYLMGSIEGQTNGKDQTVDLTVVGYRTSPEGRVMEVTAPFTGVIYLRSRAMDTYDGKSWTCSGDSDLPWPEQFLESVGEVKISTRFAHPMLYMPYYSGYSGFTDIASGIPNDKNLQAYSFTCWRLPVTMSPMSAALLSSSYHPVQLDNYLHLTPEVKTWAEPYALEITKGAGSFSEKAERIASFVRHSAEYNLETPRMPIDAPDFARWFLENSETGYCVHFATSTAVLLQAVGIPARYVTGYMTVVQAGQTTEVKSKESHAWVEYWLPGFGWTVLEATPPAALPEAPQPTEAQQTPGNDPQTPTRPTETETTAPTQQPGTTEPTAPTAQLTPKTDNQLLPVILWTATVALILAGIFFQRSLRIRLRKKRWEAAQPNARALLYWQEAVSLAALLKTSLPAELRKLAEKAKFSQHTVTEEELHSFEYFLRDAVKLLKKRNLFLQIYYCLILAKY